MFPIVSVLDNTGPGGEGVTGQAASFARDGGSLEWPCLIFKAAQRLIKQPDAFPDDSCLGMFATCYRTARVPREDPP